MERHIARKYITVQDMKQNDKMDMPKKPCEMQSREFCILDSKIDNLALTLSCLNDKVEAHQNFMEGYFVKKINYSAVSTPEASGKKPVEHDDTDIGHEENSDHETCYYSDGV